MPEPPSIWLPPTNPLWTLDSGLRSRETTRSSWEAKAAAADVFGSDLGGEPEPLTEYANDPNGYWVDVLPERPWKGRPGVPGQFELNEMLVNEDQFSVFGGTGPGKTYWISRTIHWWEMTHKNALAFWIAPTWEQVINQIGRHLRAVHARAKRNHGVPGRALQTKLDISDIWFASGMSPKDPQNIAGYHADMDVDAALESRERWLEMTNDEFFAQLKASGHEPAVLVVEDEASEIDDEVQGAADGLLTGAGCKRIKAPTTPNLTCFPEEEAEEDRDARLAKAEHQAAGEEPTQVPNEADGDGPPLWRTVRWTAFDAPEAIVDRGFVECTRRDCGPNYLENPR